MGAIHLSSNDFDKEVLASDKPVLVDFFAEWCGPCKMLSPVIDEIAEELGDRAKVFKVNIDEAQKIAAVYNIMSIPNVILFKGGEVAEQVVGVMPKDQLMKKIGEHL